MIKEAVILAGGLGTRLRSAVPDLPKPMAPIAGRPFLELLLEYWMAEGIKRFIISTGYKSEAITGYFGASYRGAEIEYAVEETPMGTGGGLMLAAQKLKFREPFLLLNGDTLFKLRLSRLYRFHLEKKADCTAALFTAPESQRYGKVESETDGRIKRFAGEKAEKGAFANGGVYLLEPAVLEGLEIFSSSLEADLLPSLIACGRKCFGVEMEGRFLDIGLPEDYEKSAGLSPDGLLQRNIRESVKAKEALLENREAMREFALAALETSRRYREGGRLYIAGNGGSAADAQHLAAEFVSKLARDRAPLPAEALTVDSSVITAIGNDYGYEQIFSRQLRGKATERDIFLGITTSGKSPNILRALETCREMGVASIVFTGHDGGEAASLADYCVIAPGKATATIQEAHIVLAHSLCEYVEREMFFAKEEDAVTQPF